MSIQGAKQFMLEFDAKYSGKREKFDEITQLVVSGKKAEAAAMFLGLSPQDQVLLKEYQADQKKAVAYRKQMEAETKLAVEQERQRQQHVIDAGRAALAQKQDAIAYKYGTAASQAVKHQTRTPVSAQASSDNKFKF